MELKLKNDRVLEASELIFDSKKLIALGRLYHTLKWFVREIWDLRSANVPLSMINSASKLLDQTGSSLQPQEEEEDESPEVKNSKRWSNQEPRPPRENNEDAVASVLLPLRGEIAK
jgi:exocyst complex component 4